MSIPEKQPSLTETLANMPRLRQKYGDQVVLDNFINLNPDKAQKLKEMRSKYNDSIIIDEILNQNKPVQKFTTDTWGKLDQKSKNAYSTTYNIQVVDPNNQTQEQTAQEQPKGVLQKAIGVVQKIDRPGREFAEKARAGYKKAMGVIPSESDLTNAINNKEYRKLQSWALEGKILPENSIKNESLKAELKRLSPDFFSKWATSQARGEINQGYAKSTLGNIGKGITEGIETLTGAENITQPSQLAINLATLAGGKLVAQATMETLVKKGLSQAVSSGKMTQKGANEVLQQYRSIYRNTPKEIARASVMGDIPTGRIPGQLPTESAIVKGKNAGWQGADAKIQRGGYQNLKGEELRKAQAQAQSAIEKDINDLIEAQSQVAKLKSQIPTKQGKPLQEAKLPKKLYQFQQRLSKQYQQEIADSEFIANAENARKQRLNEEIGAIRAKYAKSPQQQQRVINGYMQDEQQLLDQYDQYYQGLKNRQAMGEDVTDLYEQAYQAMAEGKPIPQRPEPKPIEKPVEQPIPEQTAQEAIAEQPQDIVGSEQIPQELAIQQPRDYTANVDPEQLKSDVSYALGYDGEINENVLNAVSDIDALAKNQDYTWSEAIQEMTQDGSLSKYENQRQPLPEQAIEQPPAEQAVEPKATREELKGGKQVGGIFKEGDKVYKPVVSAQGGATKEAQIYSELSGIDGVAQGNLVEKDGKQYIELPYYRYIYSVDDIPENMREKSSPAIAKNIERINNTISEISNKGINYNDWLQFGNKEGKMDLLDFSSANHDQYALEDNYSQLAKFYREFGLPRVSKAVSEGMRYKYMLDSNSAEAIRTGKEGGLDILVPDEDLQVLRQVVWSKDIVPNNVYYATNARPINLPVGQTEWIDGIKYVYSDTPLTKEQISGWELTPIYEGGKGKPKATEIPEPTQQAGANVAGEAQSLEQFVNESIGTEHQVWFKTSKGYIPYRKDNGVWSESLGGNKITNKELISKLDKELDQTDSPYQSIKELFDNGEMWDSGNLSARQESTLKALQSNGYVIKEKGQKGIHDTINGVADIWKLTKKLTGKFPELQPKQNANLNPSQFPVSQVPADEIGVRPDIMQFKRIDEAESGVNKAETLAGQWDDLKGGIMLLWQPENPAEYGLKGGQKYLVVNGHHRLQFGKENGVKAFNSQVIKEADGYSVGDARRLGAEINITEGRGDIYDQVRFLRELGTTQGKDEAMGRAGSLGVKGRQATSIAYESGDSLYSAFINQTISPEQAEIIARTAPNNDVEQQFGIKLALRGLQGDLLKGTMKAMEHDRAVARGAGQQLDLLGQDDSYIKMAEAKSKIAIDTRKAINQKILAVSGAVKRPDLARTLGVDVNDPMAVKAEVERLRGEMARWDNWSQYPDLVDRVNEKYNRQVEIEAGTPKEQALDFGGGVEQPEYNGEEFTRMSRDEKVANAKQAQVKPEPQGGLAINVIRKPKIAKGVADDVLDNHKPEAELIDQMVRPEKQTIADVQGRATGSFRAFRKTIQALTGEPLLDLKIDAKLYGQEIFNRVRNWFRTDIIGAPQKVVRLAQEDLDIVYHDLNPDEIKTFWDLIASKTMLSQYEKFYTKAIREGMTPAGAIKTAREKIPQGVDVDSMQKLYDDLYTTLASTPEGQRILDAKDRYQRYMKEILAEEIKRGNIKEVDWNGFYFPRQLLKYYDEDAYTYLPRRAQKQWRRHMMQQMGGSEDVVINEEVIRQYFLEHHMSNVIDDFAKKSREYSDIFYGTNGLRAMYNDDELKMIMGGTAPEPYRAYVINGRRYIGSQYQKGNTMFKDTVVSADKLDARVNDFLDEVGDDPEAWQIVEFLDSLTTDEPGETIKRMAMMIGKRHKTYLIPEPISRVLNNLEDLATASNPMMRYLKAYTQYWKIMTLNLSGGLKYHVGNIFGDWTNTLVLGDARTAKYAPVVGKIRSWYRQMAGQETPSVGNIRRGLEKQQIQLSEQERVITDILEQQNVLAASGLTESTRLFQSRGITRGYKQAEMMLNKVNFMREANARIALAAMKVEEFLATGGRIENGRLVGNGKISSVTFGEDIKGLAPEEAIGYLARNVAVDYLWASNLFRDTLNGFWTPFITWSHKNAVNYTRNLVNSAKQGFGVRTKGGIAEKAQAVLPIVAMIPGAMALYSNTKTSKDREYAWRNAGDFKNNPYMWVIATKSELGQDKDHPNRAVIWTPTVPSWMAMQYLGLDKVLTYINAVQEKRMSVKEAVGKIATDIPTGPLRFGYKLLNPIMKFLNDTINNKDSFTGQKIYPENAPPEIKADYILGKFLKTMITPMGTQIYQQYGSESFRASEWAKDSMRDAQRIGGAISAKLSGKDSPMEWEEIKSIAMRDAGPFGVMRALGFREIDLQKTNTNELERYMEKQKGVRAYHIDDLANAFVRDLIDKAVDPKSNPTAFAETVMGKLQSGELAPEQMTLNGETITESPEAFMEQLAAEFNRKIKSDNTIRGFMRQYTKALSPELKADAENAYQTFRKNAFLKKVKNMPEGRQIDILDMMLKDLDYDELDTND